MRELNYRPNSIARSLQGKKMKLVGLIFPEITNPFFAELVQDMLLSVPELGYDFAAAKSRVKKKFHKSTKFVAFFVNFNGGIDHYEVNSADTQDEQAWLEFKVEPETENDYKKLLSMSGNSL